MSQYTGTPTDLDVRIVSELLERGKPLCQDDHEYAAWAMAGACTCCRLKAGIPVLGGLCISCSAAMVYNHGRPLRRECDYCCIHFKRDGNPYCSEACERMAKDSAKFQQEA